LRGAALFNYGAQPIHLRVVEHAFLPAERLMIGGIQRDQHPTVVLHGEQPAFWSNGMVSKNVWPPVYISWLPFIARLRGALSVQNWKNRCSTSSGIAE
jgi:hypothetical protein